MVPVISLFCIFYWRATLSVPDFSFLAFFLSYFWRYDSIVVTLLGSWFRLHKTALRRKSKLFSHPEFSRWNWGRLFGGRMNWFDRHSEHSASNGRRLYFFISIHSCATCRQEKLPNAKNRKSQIIEILVRQLNEIPLGKSNSVWFEVSSPVSSDSS